MQSPENDHHKSTSAAGKQTLCTLSSTFLNTLKTTLESHTDFSKQTKLLKQMRSIEYHTDFSKHTKLLKQMRSGQNGYVPFCASRVISFGTTHENEKISTFPNFPFFGTLVRKSQPFIHNAFWVRWFVYGKRKQTPSTRATN